MKISMFLPQKGENNKQTKHKVLVIKCRIYLQSTDKEDFMLKNIIL